MWNDELFGLSWFVPPGWKENREKYVSQREHKRTAPLTQISSILSLTKPQRTSPASSVCFPHIYILSNCPLAGTLLYNSYYSSFKSRFLAGNRGKRYWKEQEKCCKKERKGRKALWEEHLWRWGHLELQDSTTKRAKLFFPEENHSTYSTLHSLASVLN